MHIRFADPGDAAACLAVYAQYIDTSITFETVLPSEAEFSGRIRSYGAVYPWLIAEEDGRVLAYAYAHRAQERAAYGWNAELSVYVSRDAAGRGLGTKLYTVLLALLQKQGVRTTYGVVTMPNDASSALHQKLGFRTLGTYHNTGYKTAAGSMWSGLRSPSAPSPANPGPHPHHPAPGRRCHPRGRQHINRHPPRAAKSSAGRGFGRENTGTRKRQHRVAPDATICGLLLTEYSCKIRSVKGMTLREKLIVSRNKAGLSQMELAERLGVSRQAVSAGKAETQRRPWIS